MNQIQTTQIQTTTESASVSGRAIFEPVPPPDIRASIRVVGISPDGNDGRVGFGRGSPPSFDGVHERAMDLIRENHTLFSDKETVSVLVPDITQDPGTLCGAMCYTKKFYKRPGKGPTLMVHHGAAGDGIVVPEGNLGYMATADCPVVLIRFRRTLMMLHGSRHALMDDGKIISGSSTRRYESIVQAAIQPIVERSGREVLKEMHVYCFLSVGYGRFRFSPHNAHYGELNRARNVYLAKHWPGAIKEGQYLDLPRLVHAQACELGVPPYNVALGTLSTDHPQLYSALADGRKRNSVLVLNRR